MPATGQSSSRDEAHRYVSTSINESRGERPTSAQAAEAERILTDILIAAQRHGMTSADLGFVNVLTDSIVTFVRRRGSVES
jgi:uncharacterized protein with NRDE domain